MTTFTAGTPAVRKFAERCRDAFAVDAAEDTNAAQLRNALSSQLRRGHFQAEVFTGARLHLANPGLAPLAALMAGMTYGADRVAIALEAITELDFAAITAGAAEVKQKEAKGEALSVIDSKFLAEYKRRSSELSAPAPVGKPNTAASSIPHTDAQAQAAREFDSGTPTWNASTRERYIAVRSREIDGTFHATARRSAAGPERPAPSPKPSTAAAANPKPQSDAEAQAAREFDSGAATWTASTRERYIAVRSREIDGTFRGSARRR